MGRNGGCSLTSVIAHHFVTRFKSTHYFGAGFFITRFVLASCLCQCLQGGDVISFHTENGYFCGQNKVNDIPPSLNATVLMIILIFEAVLSTPSVIIYLGSRLGKITSLSALNHYLACQHAKVR